MKENGLVNKKLILQAWTFLRKNEHSIPNETLDFMRDCALNNLEEPYKCQLNTKQ